MNISELRRAWLVQLRVLHALIMREIITRFGRNNIGFMWMIVEPMIFTLGVTALANLTKHGPGLIPVIPFTVSGYSSVLLWRGMPNRCISAIQPNLGLLYHRNVKIFDFFLSRIVLEFFGATLSFVLLTLFFIAMETMNAPEDMGKVVFAWMMLSWFGLGLAMMIGALVEMYSVVEKLWHPLTYLFFPLSGAMFMVDWLPGYMQSFMLYIPMIHGVELLREGYFGEGIHAHYDIGYMASWCLGLSLFGFTLTREISRKVMPE